MYIKETELKIISYLISIPITEPQLPLFTIARKKVHVQVIIYVLRLCFCVNDFPLRVLYFHYELFNVR